MSKTKNTNELEFVDVFGTIEVWRQDPYSTQEDDSIAIAYIDCDDGSVCAPQSVFLSELKVILDVAAEVEALNKKNKKELNTLISKLNKEIK